MLGYAQIWIGLLLAFLTLCVMLWGFGYRMGKLMTCLDQLAVEVLQLSTEVKLLVNKVSSHETQIAILEEQMVRTREVN